MNLAAPTPPASVVIVSREGGSNRPRAIGSLFAVEFFVKRGSLDRDAPHLVRFLLDQVDRHELARRAAGLRRDALLHQRAGEVVASGLERHRGEVDAEFNPRRLQIVDVAAQEQARERVHLEVQNSDRRRRHESLAEEHRVLMDEAQRDELGKAVRLLLDVAQQVDVLGTPRACALVMISTQAATSTFLWLKISRTLSSRISAAVPGIEPSPASRSIAIYSGYSICVRRAPYIISIGENACM